MLMGAQVSRKKMQSLCARPGHRAQIPNAERRVCYFGAWIQSTRTQVSALPHLHLLLRFDGRLCVTAPAPNHRLYFWKWKYAAHLLGGQYGESMRSR